MLHPESTRARANFGDAGVAVAAAVPAAAVVQRAHGAVAAVGMAVAAAARLQTSWF